MPKAEDDILTKVSKLETKAAVTEAYLKENYNRITRHREGIDKRISDLLSAIEKIENILWEGGLVSSVKENNEWIKNQCSQKNRTVNFVYRTGIAIVLAYIATKVGLS